MPVAAFSSLEVAEVARGFLVDEGLSAEVISPERRIFPIHRVVATDAVLAVPPEQAGPARELLRQVERGVAVLEEGEPTDDVPPGTG